MSTLDTGWIFIAGLILFVAWLGWTLLRSRRGNQAADEPAPLEAPTEALSQSDGAAGDLRRRPSTPIDPPTAR